MMLRTCLYEVTKCNRAEIALSLLRENKNGYDVVMSDVVRKEKNGNRVYMVGCSIYPYREKRDHNIDITREVEEDIYADIFGAEKRNRVRGMGTGYTWSDVPFIHTEKRGVSKEVAALRGAVEEQTRVAERASMEVERLRTEAERERNEVYDRERQREAEFEKIKDEQKQVMEKMQKMEENMQISLAAKMVEMMKGVAGQDSQFLNFFQQIPQVSSSQGELQCSQ